MTRILPELAYDLERFMRGEQPSTDELEKAPRLTRWYVKKTRELTDGGASLSLAGIISGHDMIHDGEDSTTSSLFWLDPGRKWARTWSRIYALDDEDIDAYSKESM